MGYNYTRYLRLKKRYDERKKQGLCVTCDNKAEPGKVSCRDCREKQQMKYREKKKKLLGSMEVITTKNKKTVLLSDFLIENFKGMKHGGKINKKQDNAYYSLDKFSKQKLPFMVLGRTFIDRKELLKEVNEILKEYTGKYVLKKTIAYKLAERHPDASAIAFSRELTAMIPEKFIVLQDGSIVVFKVEIEQEKQQK